MASLIDILNADPELQRRGKFYSTCFAIQEGDARTRFEIDNGEVVAVDSTSDERIDMTFIGDASAWAKFREDCPEPGFHDISAMIDRGHLQLDGDVRPWLYNMLYIKRLITLWKANP